jgi:hypothetical protein
MQHRIPAATDAYSYLRLEEADFVKQCRVDAYAASGPGGQKRNRTYSAIRVVHVPTGIISIAEESRSQHENRRRALRRLKKKIALSLRAQTPATPARDAPEVMRLFGQENPARINPKNPAYPLVCAMVLDSLLFAGGKISATAMALGVSTGRLNSLLLRDRELLAAANALRKQFSLRALKS